MPSNVVVWKSCYINLHTNLIKIYMLQLSFMFRVFCSLTNLCSLCICHTKSHKNRGGGSNQNFALSLSKTCSPQILRLMTILLLILSHSHIFCQNRTCFGFYCLELNSISLFFTRHVYSLILTLSGLSLYKKLFLCFAKWQLNWLL